jgi:sulfite reductase (ferredoxin)
MSAEEIKASSRHLRGTLAAELENDDTQFAPDSTNLLKFHGIYQQDDRDHRKDKNADGTAKGRQYIFMVRTRVPGGKVSGALVPIPDNH